MSQFALSLFTIPPTIHTVKPQQSVGLIFFPSAEFFQDFYN